MEAPKVSIVIPSLNVASYVRECLNSVIGQTLREIEIICVDAGSTDGTREILQKYAEKDARILIIDSPRKSYGYQMNLGLDAAAGEYIGIVETDDFVEPDMFEKLLTAALRHNADVVKSNYYWHCANRDDTEFENLARCQYERVFCPLQEKTIFTTTPSIWSGIYKRQMLLANSIRFNETPGASYQDTSFHFMSCFASQRYYLIKDCLLHYRKDSANSSTNTFNKVFCVSDEMHYFQKYLDAHALQNLTFQKYFMTLKYEKYKWNYEHLAAEYQWDFLKLVYKEFTEAKQNSWLQEEFFSPAAWDDLNSILKSPLRYFMKTCKCYYARPDLSTAFTPPVQLLKKAA